MSDARVEHEQRFEMAELGSTTSPGDAPCHPGLCLRSKQLITYRRSPFEQRLHRTGRGLMENRICQCPHQSIK
jgi:hypothetical protein